MATQESAAPTEIDYGIANLSLDMKTQILGSVASYGAHLDAISPSDNIEAKLELTPNRSRFMRRLLARGRDMELRKSPAYYNLVKRWAGLDRHYDWSDEDDVFRRIISGHAGFLDETPGHGVLGMLFPDTKESLEQLDLVGTAIGRQLNGIVYGQYLGESASYAKCRETAEAQGKLWTPFGVTSIQPKQADFAKMGISEETPAEEVIGILEGHGIDRGTLDVAHIQTFTNPEAMTDKLVDWFDSIHLALNRYDVAGVMEEGFARKSAQAKAHFEKGDGAARKTLEGQLVQRVVASWKRRGHRGRIIYEEKAIYTATNREVRRYHKAILETVATLAESTPAN